MMDLILHIRDDIHHHSTFTHGRAEAIELIQIYEPLNPMNHRCKKQQQPPPTHTHA